MPTYDYRCENCKKNFEVEQKISEEPLKVCPRCGNKKIRRLISQGNFILKGSGWYSDLYSGPSNQKKKEEKKVSSDSTKSKKAEINSGDSNKNSSTSKKKKS